MRLWRCTCSVAVALFVAAGLVAGQGPVSEGGLLGEAELSPHLRRFARSVVDVRRGEASETDLLEAFPPPAAGVAPRDAAIAWYMRALALGAASRPGRKVRQALEAATGAYRRFPQAHLMLANVELAADHPERARARLETVVAMAPGHERALLALGDLARQRGDHPAALRCYEQAVSRHPDSVAARERKARACIALKRLPAALDEARRIRGIEGDDSGRFFALVAQVYLAGGDLISACKALEKGVEVCAESARVGFLRRLLGWYRLAANQHRMKLTLDRLLATKGLAATERSELAKMNEELREFDEAAFLLWNFRWQVRAVRDPRVAPADRLTAMKFLCHVRRGGLRKHLEPDAQEELDLLWWSALAGVTRSRDGGAAQHACAFLESHPDPAAVPFLARLVHPSNAAVEARRAAVDALGAAWRPALLPLLLQCLEDPDPEVVRKADQALRRRVPLDAAAPDPRARWRRWIATAEGRKRLAAVVDPFRSDSLWGLVAGFKLLTGKRFAAPALARAVMPILRAPVSDPDLFVNAYLFLERSVDDGGWRKRGGRVEALRDGEVPAIAAAVERWYQRGAPAFTWKGNP